MSRKFQHLGFTLAAPLLSIGLLGGIVLENSGHIRPENVEPYHQEMKKLIGLQTIAIDELGKTVGEATGQNTGQISHIIGSWYGKDDPIPPAAQKLLRPNGILSRTYTNPASHGNLLWAVLLIVQCRDTRDMQGHYPPICYVAHGETLEAIRPRTWSLPGREIRGTEYEFSSKSNGKMLHRIVYNFLVVPGKGIQPDMDALMKASEMYEQRAYGAAQFQLVLPMDGDEVVDADLRKSNTAERDAIFQQMFTTRYDVDGDKNPDQSLLTIVDDLDHPERVTQ